MRTLLMTSTKLAHLSRKKRKAVVEKIAEDLGFTDSLPLRRYITHLDEDRVKGIFTELQVMASKPRSDIRKTHKNICGLLCFYEKCHRELQELDSYLEDYTGTAFYKSRLYRKVGICSQVPLSIRDICGYWEYYSGRLCFPVPAPKSYIHSRAGKHVTYLGQEHVLAFSYYENKYSYSDYGKLRHSLLKFLQACFRVVLSHRNIGVNYKEFEQRVHVEAL